MSSLQTQYGYTIFDGPELVPMLSLADFNTMTANKFAGDVRIEKLIDAASTAIRDYCGWHIYPDLVCEVNERYLLGHSRIIRSSTDLLVQLPATFVSSVDEVTIGGDALDAEDYFCATYGLLRLFDAASRCLSRKTAITVKYNAGINAVMMASIKELIVSRVSRALTATNGVSSETAGGVTVSYNAGWINGGGAGSLQATDVEILKPYNLTGVV